MIALTILALLVTDGLAILVGSFAGEHLASRFATDARDELYTEQYAHVSWYSSLPVARSIA